jgi:diketogulonate reductase-like aldo/keto reductase
MLERIIPSSGERLPVMGLGTWQTFDIAEAIPSQSFSQVLRELHQAGGTLIDSSPMYGRAEAVIGRLTQASGIANVYFYATKVWTQGKEAGIRQMEASLHKLQRSSLDLMQIHNLVDWKNHLPTLRDWKEKGIIRYIGITHYTDAMHGELAKIISTVPVDFAQFNYSITARNAEKQLLPMAMDNGVATLINRPFGEGVLFSNVKGRVLPPWASELGIESWSQFVLKFILSHPAVTCVIPATGNPQHLLDNIKAGSGPLPDSNTREKMAALMASI